MIRRVLLHITLGASGAVVLTALAWATAEGQAALRGDDSATVDDIVGLAAVAGAWIAALWLLAGFCAALLAARPGSGGGRSERLALAIAPSIAWRLARLAAGVTVVGCGVATPYSSALADSAPPVAPDLDRPVITGTAVPDPDDAGDGDGRACRAPASGEAHHQQQVVVVPGDTLWSIAAAALQHDPSNPEIAAEWPRWYSANRQVIGPNPNLIRPGQRLQPPAGAAG